MSKLSKIDYHETQSFYDERCIEHGDSIVSVGWRDKASQSLRFEQLLKGIDVNNKVILDIGCGLGDLVYFLEEKAIKNYRYIGLDISRELLNQAEKRFSDRSDISFFHGDLFEFIETNNIEIDIAISSGMLSYKTGSNQVYAKNVLEMTFSLIREAMSFNFLTDKADYTLEKNFHYDCIEVLNWVKPLSHNFTLDHCYPLWEFTVQVHK